jgi:hypothetical protein
MMTKMTYFTILTALTPHENQLFTEPIQNKKGCHFFCIVSRFPKRPLVFALRDTHFLEVCDDNSPCLGRSILAHSSTKNVKPSNTMLKRITTKVVSWAMVAGWAAYILGII